MAIGAACLVAYAQHAGAQGTSSPPARLRRQWLVPRLAQRPPAECHQAEHHRADCHLGYRHLAEHHLGEHHPARRRLVGHLTQPSPLFETNWRQTCCR